MSLIKLSFNFHYFFLALASLFSTTCFHFIDTLANSIVFGTQVNNVCSHFIFFYLNGTHLWFYFWKSFFSFTLLHLARYERECVTLTNARERNFSSHRRIILGLNRFQCFHCIKLRIVFFSSFSSSFVSSMWVLSSFIETAVNEFTQSVAKKKFKEKKENETKIDILECANTHFGRRSGECVRARESTNQTIIQFINRTIRETFFFFVFASKTDFISPVTTNETNRVEWKGNFSMHHFHVPTLVKCFTFIDFGIAMAPVIDIAESLEIIKFQRYFSSSFWVLWRSQPKWIE